MISPNIDSMESIAKDPNVSLADRIKSKAVKREALVMTQDAIEASVSCPDPHSVLKKIVEQSSSRQQC
jgi:2,3-bisphosphoglycerate-independent phosphoglycerate mutase